MLWVRRFFGQIFSALFLLSLLLLALTFSLHKSFSEPTNLETWLAESQLYDHFIDNVLDQTNKTVSGEGRVPSQVSSAVFQNAAKQTFTPELIEQSVNSFIDSNYDWLQGSTKVPTFSIDLTAAKLNFARQVALYTEQHLLSLPKCTPEQSALYNADSDPLSLICLPSSVVPEQVAQRIQQELAVSGDFLANPVITPENLNPDAGKPYYQVMPDAPKYYQLSKYVPLAIAVLAVLLGIIVFFLSLTRRKGVRRLGIVFVVAGVFLIAGKFVADFVLDKIEAKAFNNANVGELQVSLSNFLGRIEGAILSVTLLFGVAYLLLGIALLLSLRLRRRTKNNHRNTILDDNSSQSTPVLQETPTAPETPRATDVPPRPRLDPTGPPPVRPANPGTPKRKKPRLVQF